LAIAGISVVGRDHYGVFPLKGKLLNVRDAAHAQITANQEITHLKQILGLQQGKVYTDTKSLRYGHLMVMTDQDHDGSHIKGLIINLLHHYWPSLLKLPGFLTEFITPIVKATKGHDSKVFYTVPEYENWREATPKVHLWEIKYYKGLGTSTREEARHYFSNIVKHRIAFEWSGDEDGKLIDMAFNKKYADRRKQWISECKDGTFVDHTSCRLNYSDFINKELVLFSIADNKRSIPSMMDGLKPGQRKILFGCFLKNDLKSQIKVAQLSGHVSEKTAYHHGEVSLQTTIVNMAQNYVGANNLNFLEPLGQFGTRLCGGKDAASARYIFTRLSPIVRSMFPKVDDALLTYLDDDGLSVEPEFYAPILPTVLLNGASGIGTGWSTTVLQYNPRDICAALKSIMQGYEPAEIHPWYRGFTGTVSAKFAGRAQVFDGYSIDGCIEEVGPTTVRVTELPIETWTQTYKDWLETLLAEGKIKDYKNYSTDTTVDFVIELPSTAAMEEAKATGLKKKFRLSAMVATSNMVLFDDENKLQRYASVSDIIKDFYRVRAPLYEKRKQHLVDNLRSELIKLENQVRFIEDVCAGRLKVANKKKSELFQEMSAKGFVALVNNKKNDDEEADVVVGEKGFDYLLSMPIYSLTQEKVNAFQASMRAKSTELDALLQTTPQQLWARDLDAFEVALDTFEEELMQVEERGNQGGKSKRGGAKSKYVDSDDDNAFDDDEDDEDFGAKKKKPAKKVAAKKELAPAAQNNAKHLHALSSRVQHSESSTERKTLQMVVQKSTGAAIKETKADSKPVEEEIEFEELSLFERLQRRNASVAAVGGLMKEKKETKKKLPAKAQSSSFLCSSRV
jgi:DNA topoisomerase-2